MRFVDASVFVHAILNPKRKLKSHEIQMKNSAKNIAERIYKREKVGITAVQISEIANLLESYHTVDATMKLERFLIFSPNITIFSVTKNNLMQAYNIVDEYKENNLGLSDSIAYVVMIKHSIDEIYSFDKHFDVFESINRITE